MEAADEEMTRRKRAAARLAVAIALVGACCVTGCSRGPTPAQVAADFHAIYPGCHLASSGPGEGDADNVHIVVEFRCGEHDNREELLYQRFDGAWEISWIEAGKDRHLGPPRVDLEAARAMAERAARSEGIEPERCRIDPFPGTLSQDARAWQFVYGCGPLLPPYGFGYTVTVDRYTGKVELVRSRH
jgi:hypothetical protein